MAKHMLAGCLRCRLPFASNTNSCERAPAWHVATPTAEFCAADSSAWMHSPLGECLTGPGTPTRGTIQPNVVFAAMAQRDIFGAGGESSGAYGTRPTHGEPRDPVALYLKCVVFASAEFAQMAKMISTRKDRNERMNTGGGAGDRMLP